MAAQNCTDDDSEWTTIDVSAQSVSWQDSTDPLPEEMLEQLNEDIRQMLAEWDNNSNNDNE